MLKKNSNRELICFNNVKNIPFKFSLYTTKIIEIVSKLSEANLTETNPFEKNFSKISLLLFSLIPIFRSILLFNKKLKNISDYISTFLHFNNESISLEKNKIELKNIYKEYLPDMDNEKLSKTVDLITDFIKLPSNLCLQISLFEDYLNSNKGSGSEYFCNLNSVMVLKFIYIRIKIEERFGCSSKEKNLCSLIEESNLNKREKNLLKSKRLLINEFMHYESRYPYALPILNYDITFINKEIEEIEFLLRVDK